MKKPDEKKTYSTPELTVWGRVEAFTRRGGGGLTDMPFGPDVDPNDIACSDAIDNPCL